MAVSRLCRRDEAGPLTVVDPPVLKGLSLAEATAAADELPVLLELLLDRVEVEGVYEGLPELLRHQTVEDEVDGAVGQGHGVHDLAQRMVALVKEPLVDGDGRQEAENALGELGEEEKDKDRDQKPRGPVGALLAVGGDRVGGGDGGVVD